MPKFIIALFVALLLSACSHQASVTSESDSASGSQSETMEETEESAEDMVEAYDIAGQLEDVSGGASTGEAMARYSDGEYQMVATFSDLPEAGDDFFYEGWVVRKDPQSVISTGVIELVDGEFVNEYTADKDLLDHDFYVLTLEPTNDGPDGLSPDPAPAEHILEGTMVSVDN